MNADIISGLRNLKLKWIWLKKT